MNGVVSATEKNNSFKERTKNKAPIRPVGAHKVFEKYVSDMNHYMSFARIAKDMRNVFDDQSVQLAIRQATGSNVANELLQSNIDDIIRGGLAKGKVDKFINKMIGNLAVSKIALNLPSALKQLGSIPAYADVMPSGQWVSGFAEFFTNVSENAKLLLETDYMKNRLSKSYDRDLRTIASKNFEKEVAGIRNFRDRIMVLTRLGDAGAIIAGGWPVYSYYKKQALQAGKTEVEAHEEGVRRFVRATDRAQQSAEIMSQGYWQRGGGLAKLFTMYQTSPIQYNRIMVGAIKGWKRGQISGKQAAKTVFIYHVLLPQIFTAMGSLGIGAFSEDDERFKKFWDRQFTALIVGNFNSVFMAGDAYDAVVKALFSDAERFEKDISIPLMEQLQDFVKAADHLDEGEIIEGADDLFSALLSFAGMPYDPVRNRIENTMKAFDENEENPIISPSSGGGR